MSPNPGPSDGKREKSYISSAVESFNPWGGSRSSTPVPQRDEASAGILSPAFGPGKGDHSKTYLYGQSLRSYPPDCPPLSVRWFHAVDAPKRKPEWFKSQRKPAQAPKPPPLPKKFVAFSPSDSRSIESEYQKLLEEAEEERERLVVQGRHVSSRHPGGAGAATATATAPNHTASFNSEEGLSPGLARTGAKVPVNEDFLFEVDIRERELAPVYWEGLVYEVRRGTWFFQEGSTVRPCEENLAAQLEQGYLKVRPWLYSASVLRRNSISKSAVTPKPSTDNLRAVAAAQASMSEESATPESAAAAAAAAAARLRSSTTNQQHQPQSHRLFGTYMNSFATYQDSTTAWLSTDSMLSWVTSSVYERFAGGGYMSGIKLVRGYSEQGKGKDKEKDQVDSPAGSEGKTSKPAKRRSAPPGPGTMARLDDLPECTAVEQESAPPVDEDQAAVAPPAAPSREAHLQRKLSELIEAKEARSPDEAEEQIRRREEQEIQDDYNNAECGETQNREIEHLILVTHGIGQLLTARMESSNFVHDVNVLRKSLKSVYATSADLKGLNDEVGEGVENNSRVQVLPVCWRHLLDFPRRQRTRQEHDLGDATSEEDKYPSLEDITVEGVTFVRSLVSDLALDVLLYQSAYREQISTIVTKESNRIYGLFRERNPNFRGKVHIMGHSLGSAIMFDILCRQRDRKAEERSRHPLGFMSLPDPGEHGPKEELGFDFDVEDLYCLGSPIGLFQMLKGRTIAARGAPTSLASESPLNPDFEADSFLVGPGGPVSERISAVTGLPFSVSSPKAGQLYNIFHPSDPISYRIEPLISAAMSTLKPQALPYTKKGIFGAVAPQGLTGIGAKVGQSVSGLFSSLSAGIASSLLNRSLGISNEDVARMAGQAAAAGSGGNGSVLLDPGAADRASRRKRQLGADLSSASTPSPSNGPDNNAGWNDPTLLDHELETLYSQFQRQQMDLVKDDRSPGPDEWKEENRKARQMRMEEMKVRALNRNGRVDYCIQESVLDFNPINTIASHMSYWADEDVGHFVLSQLLANKSRPRPR